MNATITPTIPSTLQIIMATFCPEAPLVNAVGVAVAVEVDTLVAALDVVLLGRVNPEVVLLVPVVGVATADTVPVGVLPVDPVLRAVAVSVDKLVINPSELIGYN
jgi:hypothetical protein